MTFFYSQGKIRMALFGIHILSIFPFQLSQMILAVGRYPLCKVYSTFLRNNNSIGTWKRMPPHFLVFSLGMVCLPGRYFFFLSKAAHFRCWIHSSRWEPSEDADVVIGKNQQTRTRPLSHCYTNEWGRFNRLLVHFLRPGVSISTPAAPISSRPSINNVDRT